MEEVVQRTCWDASTKILEKCLSVLYRLLETIYSQRSIEAFPSSFLQGHNEDCGGEKQICHHWY